MNDPNLTFNRSTGRLDYHVSWTPAVELVGYKVKTEYRTISSTGAPGSWQYGGVMAAWSTDCRYGPGHASLSVDPSAYAYEVRWIRQDGSVVDYSKVYGTAKTTHEFDAPAPPTGLRVIDVNQGSVTLAWTDTTGEASYRLERSEDRFQTIDAAWTLSGDSTVFVDEAAMPARRYWYRISASNLGGSSGFVGHVEVDTPNLFIPDVPGIESAIYGNCGDWAATPAAIGQCVRQEMSTYGVYSVTVRICHNVDGVWVSCQAYVFALPESPPELPDEGAPSVPPTINPDGSVWVPRSKPGEPPWEWDGDLADYGTKYGRFTRPCPDGEILEVLHRDSPHGPGKPDHWGYYDCNQKAWDRPFDLAKYANQWLEEELGWWK